MNCGPGRRPSTWRSREAATVTGRAGERWERARSRRTSWTCCGGECEVAMFRAILDKIKAGLSRTRSVFSGIATLFRLKGKVDRDFLGELEKRLYLADVG